MLGTNSWYLAFYRLLINLRTKITLQKATKYYF